MRFNKATPYRGGEANNMLEEFIVYGLNETFLYIIGGLKVLAAIGLLIGLINQKFIKPSAFIIALLMIGAIVMHFKVSDEIIKFLPATLMLIGSASIILLAKAER